MVEAAKPKAVTSRRRARARHPTGGHMAALEGVFVGMLMVSGIAFYVTMDLTPHAPTVTAEREPVEAMAGDLLEGLKDLPTSEAYATHLERAISKAVQDNTTSFDLAVKRTMPAGTECRLFLDNGHARRQLAGPHERLARESVSRSVLWRPEWAYAFTVPAMDLVASSQALPVQGYEVSQGTLVKENGVPLQFTLTTSGGTYDRAAISSVRSGPTVSLTLRNETGGIGFHHKEGLLSWTSQNQWSSSAAGPLPTPQNFAVPAGHDFLNVTLRVTGAVVAYTATFTDPLGVPWPVVATGAGSFPLSIPAPAAGTWTFAGAGTITGILGNPASAAAWANATRVGDIRNYTLVLRESAGQAIPAGTVLNISMPGVFTELSLTPSPQGGWTSIQSQESLDTPQWVSAALAAPLSNGALDFSFQARRPPNGNALYALHANLTGGAAAHATFVVGGSTGVTTLGNPVEPDLYVSVPKPMAPGSTATWGAVFPLATGGTTLSETATKLEVATADGAALFAGVQGVAPAGTWTVVSPNLLRWTGSAPLAANNALSFVFNVTAVNATTAHEPGIALPVSFATGARFQMSDMERPYVYATSIPPPTDLLGAAQAGYEVPAGAGPLAQAEARFNVSQVQRGALVQGQGAYNVSTFGTLSSVAEALRLGLARSHLNLSRQAADLGEAVNVTVDLQALYDGTLALGSTISGWNVEVAIFDPAQPFQDYRQMEASFKGQWGTAGSMALDVSGTSSVASVARWTLASPADLRTPARGNFTFAAPRDAFFGPHAIVAQANFAINDASGNSLLQSVRLLGVIDVLPDSGQSGTALYYATLECWLPDW